MRSFLRELVELTRRESRTLFVLLSIIALGWALFLFDGPYRLEGLSCLTYDEMVLFLKRHHGPQEMGTRGPLFAIQPRLQVTLD